MKNFSGRFTQIFRAQEVSYKIRRRFCEHEEFAGIDCEFEEGADLDFVYSGATQMCIIFKLRERCLELRKGAYVIFVFSGKEQI